MRVRVTRTVSTSARPGFNVRRSNWNTRRPPGGIRCRSHAGEPSAAESSTVEAAQPDNHVSRSITGGTAYSGYHTSGGTSTISQIPPSVTTRSAGADIFNCPRYDSRTRPLGFTSLPATGVAGVNTRSERPSSAGTTICSLTPCRTLGHCAKRRAGKRRRGYRGLRAGFHSAPAWARLENPASGAEQITVASSARRAGGWQHSQARLILRPVAIPITAHEGRGLAPPAIACDNRRTSPGRKSTRHHARVLAGRITGWLTSAGWTGRERRA